MNSSLEILESRIAPATFLVSSVQLKITNTANPADVPDAREIAASVAAGASAAVFLAPGDSIVFDTNADGIAEKTEPVLVKVNAGNALAFFFDANGDQAFSRGELSGLAVGDLFSGSIGGDVGSIVTALDANGNFTASGTNLTIQHASIAKLNVAGAVVGDIFAGDNVSNVVIGKSQLFTNKSSVASILSGTQIAGHTVQFGSVQFSTHFSLNANELGGNISNVTLALGALEIAAGDGADGANGGSVKNVAMLSATGNALITAGSGGSSVTVSGLAGSIDGVSIASQNIDAVNLLAGSGGNGTSGGKVSHVNLNIANGGSISIFGGGGGSGGGAGGALESIAVKLGTLQSPFTAEAGSGSDGTAQNSSGGAGGGLRGITLTSSGSDGGIIITAGGGGKGFGDGAGGSGGGIRKVTLNPSESSEIVITAGNGGDAASLGAGNGGAGGAIGSIAFSGGLQDGALSVIAGVGGAGGGSGNGGAGGALEGVVLAARSGSTNDSRAIAGNGGNGGLEGGAGGAISGLIVGVSKRVVDGQSFSVFAGNGGTGAAGAGGSGGAVASPVFINAGVFGPLTVKAGNGGASSGGAGGAGGSNFGGSFTNVGSSQNGALFRSGDGGAGALGGNAGDVLGITFTNFGVIQTGLSFQGGDGGNGSSASGGAGGAVSAITLNDSISDGAYEMDGGFGGTGGGVGNGGKGGSVSGIQMNALFASLSGVAGNGGHGISGGVGGRVVGIAGTIGRVDLSAGDGGAATSGNGGAGGAISDLNLNVTRFVELLNAGSGGDSTSGAGGIGGSLLRLHVAGDIGRFEGAQNFGDAANTMGGLIAGLGGQGTGAVLADNGSVSDVTARRISAIVAANFDSPPLTGDLGARNAVFAISNVVANRIGTDLNNNGVFDFVDLVPTTGVFNLLGVDIAIDGLVLVRAAGLTATSLSVSPLKLLTV